ncbi:MAG: inverse autotransporter beta domain-containing protein [Rhodospirillales bacterium]|nr:MAG: inverse autotransporter beta domain-containing protein [Rhodospirillales bacterium]
MMYRPFIYALACSALSALAVLPSLPALAQEAPLQARGEMNWRLGSERSILMSEFWVPIAQAQDSVLYGDLRLMGDDRDNREGNIGLGYRRILPGGKALAGGHLWFDRRLTDRGSMFHQITGGAELLGEAFDLRANGYLPLSGKKEYTVPTVNPQGPALAGTGIFVDTNGRLLEEPQYGLDLELGWRVPYLEGFTDSVRLYGGGYHFDGDHTENVTGWRARFAADITPDIQVGARFQRDAARGSQGFLEATIRFPFGQKKSFRKEGLRARLDESPERDIDIVTGAQVTDTGARVPVINASTGAAQEVLHVDNTAAGGGDGSAENPFNTLADAQAAASAQTIIYVKAGDGTTTNQDQGIVLDKTGQQLIGSGANFLYDSGRFRTANGISPTSILIAAATSAPKITNVNALSDGVRITANDVTVAGITVDGATRDGIVVEADGAAASAIGVSIQNVSALNNRFGIYVHGTNGGSVSAKVQGAVTSTNTQHGVAIYDDTAGTFTADLGGGALGSTGGNVLAGNTLEDLAVELDGGTLMAQNNWWGQASGPDTDDPSVGIAPQIYYGAPINDGLVGHWTFDTEWTTNTTAYDRSGNGNDGTPINGLSLTDQVVGVNREALEFDGIDDAVSMGNILSMGLNSFTIVSNAQTTVVNFNDNSNGIVYTKGTGFSSQEGYRLSLPNGAFNVSIADGTNFATHTSSAGRNDGTWHFVSAVFDRGNEIRVTVDNSYNSSTVENTIGNITSPYNFAIGALNTAGNIIYHPFDGQIDDTRIYNRALLPSEISELYRMDTSSAVDTSGFLTAAP